jgi:uncharacterized protein (TIGR03437 family)
MQITVQITDSSKRSYGFELTARTGTGNRNQAGDFTTTDGNTQVICQDSSTKANGKTCPSAFPVEDIEHSYAGWMNSVSTRGSFTYTFNWTPPASSVGAVTLYVAANCGSGTDNQNGTNVYLANITLQPAAANPNAPSILQNGVVPLYSSTTTVQPGSWISIYGNNLATSTATWDGSFPTMLGGASVTIDNKPAYLYFASAGQINAQAPDDTARGTVPVTVTTPNGTATSTVNLANAAPGFLLLDARHVTGIILRADGSGAFGSGSFDIVGPTGNSLGYKTVAAKAGDSLVLFGVGFGPTSPSVPAGAAFSGAAATTNPVSLLINNKTVTPAFAGLSSAGLYQLNVTVPSGLGTGDVPLQATVAGVTTQTGIVLSLQ